MYWFEIYIFRLWADVWKVAQVAGRGTVYRSQTQGIYLFIYFLLVCSVLITVSKKSYPWRESQHWLSCVTERHSPLRVNGQTKTKELNQASGHFC